jgi:23S rRNA (guanosine2251-2'-O)-methyltransferase
LDDTHLLFGFHAVEAALANPQRVILRAFLTENAERRLAPSLAKRTVTPQRVTPQDLDRRLGRDTVHQGVLLEVEELDEPDLSTVVAEAAGRPLVVLDQVTDPHNFGAILRSCAVFGVAAVVTTRRHSPALGGVLAKAASGALEVVPIVRVQNLARGLADLAEMGVTVCGLDDAAEEAIEDMAWPEQVALVLGAEGKGLREGTRAACDRLIRITAEGPIGSLNVSNAGAVALHMAAIALRRRAGASAPSSPAGID